MAEQEPQAEKEKDSEVRLGSLALEAGLITPEDLENALKRQRELKTQREYRHLGTLLVESGKITAERLEDLLNQQTKSWEGRRVVGRYRLMEKLGEGSMGAVWKASHIELGNAVAIKLLPRAVLGNANLVERFHREARLQATVNHTNIVQAFDAGDADGQPFFVMPCLDGASLGEVLGLCRRLGVRTALSIALQVVRGLQYAHEHGWVHRDLKPDNLFVTNDGTVKILDLGLTKLMEDAAPGPSKNTQADFVVGTPHYMAPEQILTAQSIDGRADLYALGCTLFQMLCGEVPFTGEKVADVFKQKVDLPAPDPNSMRADLPVGVRKLLLSLLARRASDRPPDAASVEAAIEELLEGRPITGSLLSPGNIVQGRSEREVRVPAGPAPALEPGAHARKENRPGADSTSEMPRPAQTEAAPSAAQAVRTVAPLTEHPSPPRIHVGWFGQFIAAVVLIVLTVIVTVAVIRLQDEQRRNRRPPVERGP